MYIYGVLMNRESDNVASIVWNKRTSFPVSLRSPCMKSATYGKRTSRRRRGEHSWYPQECRQSVEISPTKHKKYVVNQKLEHLNGHSFGEVVGIWMFDFFIYYYNYYLNLTMTLKCRRAIKPKLFHFNRCLNCNNG